jgi:hypothetical protein
MVVLFTTGIQIVMVVLFPNGGSIKLNARKNANLSQNFVAGYNAVNMHSYNAMTNHGQTLFNITSLCMHN